MEGFCPLASGSKGNAIFFGTKNTRLLIDVGLSLNNLQRRLEEIKIDVRDIDGILITHEHSDHISGLSSLALKYKIPVFANSDTAQAIVEILGKSLKFKIFSTGETFEFGELEIHPFSIQHDTVDPVAFIIKTSRLKMGFCTDLGFVTTLVKNNLTGCDYVYLEANHHPPMVNICNRSLIYKQRVLGRQGHLSNEQCGSLLAEIAHSGLKHVHLAHLSQECNRPELALEIVENKLKTSNFTINISIAYQEKISHPILF